MKKNKRTSQIHIHVTAHEKERIQGFATIHGMNTSEYLRNLLLGQLVKKELLTQ